MKKLDIQRISIVDYIDGLTDAYIELLERGIRDVCMPSVGDPEGIPYNKNYLYRRTFLDLVDRKAKAHGFGVLPVVSKCEQANSFIDNRSGTIIFKKSAKPKALILRQLLLKDQKTVSDHRKMGRLFGYGEKEIREFIARSKNGAR